MDQAVEAQATEKSRKIAVLREPAAAGHEADPLPARIVSGTRRPRGLPRLPGLSSMPVRESKREPTKWLAGRFPHFAKRQWKMWGCCARAPAETFDHRKLPKDSRRDDCCAQTSSAACDAEPPSFSVSPALFLPAGQPE